jgi:translation initiation factor IF-3
MRRTYRRKKYKPDKTQFRANARIKVPEVRLIDQDGTMRGVMTTKEALDIAKAAKLDLVEVNPTAVPPIARIQDFGKMAYEREKIKQKQKAAQKTLETKGVRLTFRISEHDRMVRVKQSVKFLNKGHKVKFELIVRGRENAHMNVAFEKAKSFIEDIKGLIEEGELIVESPPKKEGHRITSIIILKKSS